MEKELSRAMGTQGRNMSCLGDSVLGTPALQRDSGQRGQGWSCPECPRSFPSPFPTYVLFKPQCSQPHSSPWPVKTSLHSALVELSQEKDLGRFGGDFGPNTTGHTNSLTLAFHGTGMVEIRFSFPSKLLSSPQHKLSRNLDFL